MNTKAGFVSIIGKPNVGKSTLINALLGQKLSIVTNKPQTTRKNILGILSEEDYQIVFLDTPGILKPSYLLQERMLDYVHHSLIDTDVVLFLMDIEEDPTGEKTVDSLRESEEEEEENKLRKVLIKRKKSKASSNFLVINKVDKSQEETLNKIVDKFEKLELFDEIIPISAALNFNVDSLLKQMLEKLPEHPKYYPDDQLSDANERFFVSEIIREKIFELYQEEIPYSTEVLIEDFKEEAGKKDHISASIVVEKNSQKPIIIGKQGKAIKKLGSVAREDIEEFLQRPVFLEIRVKVREKWRSKDNFLKSYGYSIDD